MEIQGSKLAGKPLNQIAVDFQGRAQLFGGPSNPNVRDLYRDIATRQNGVLKSKMQNPQYDVSNRIQNYNNVLTQHMNIMENPNMQKMASYKEVYQLYKKAGGGWWDDIKAGAGKAWDSFNDYADKNEWVRPALYGLGGAGAGFGLGSIFKNPLLRVLFTVLGGAGGLYGGLKHNQSRPYYNVDNSPVDPQGLQAAQGAVEQQALDETAANQAKMKATKAPAQKATAKKPESKAPVADHRPLTERQKNDAAHGPWEYGETAAASEKNISKSPASYTAKDPHQGQTFGADVPKAPSYKAALSDPNYRKMFYGKPLMQRLKEDAAKDPTDQLTEFVTRENQKAAQQEAQTDRVIAQDLPKIMQANKDIKNPSSYAPTVLLDRRRPNKPFSPTALRGQPEDWYTYGTGRYDLQDNMFGRGRKDVPVSRLTIKGPYQLYRKSGLLEKLRQLRTLKGLDPYQR